MSTSFFSLDLGGRFARREKAVGERLQYTQHIDEFTVQTRDGQLVQIVRLDGLEAETADNQELAYRKSVRETLIRALSSPRLTLYHHVIRREVSPYFGGGQPEGFAAALDTAWREAIASRRLYANDLYLTLALRPSIAGRGGARRRSDDERQDLRRLTSLRENLVSVLSPYGARPLGTVLQNGVTFSEPCAFLARLAGGTRERMSTPSNNIGHALCERRLTFGLDAMELGPGGGRPTEFACAISMKDYPARTSPGMFDPLLRLPCELVMTESFGFVERQRALERMGVALRRLRAADDDAFSLREELAAARDDVGSGRAVYGEHHLSVLVKAASLQELDEAAAEAQAALAEAGAIAVREDVNLEPSFWAQFPGNQRYIARRAMVSAANFASLAALHNHSQGETKSHWGDPVTVLETTAAGPYYFNFHHQDLGNFTVIGPSGSGKTVLMTFLLAQAQKFRPNIVYFDKDRGAEAFVRALGGRYDVLRPGEPSGLNPLSLPDSPANRSFLTAWVAELLGGQNVLSAEDLAIIGDAVDANFGQPSKHRRLRYLRELLSGARRPRAGDLAARLKLWCDGGEHAWLFDEGEDLLTLGRGIYGFDMTRLLDTPVTRTPAMMYLFHRIEHALDGQPTIIVVDEGWKALDDQVFTRRLKDWEKTIRKRNGIVGFCTQSAADALESRIASAIVEQAATQIFFPNHRAKAADYIDGFGLTEHEFELIRTLPDTSRSFLVKQPGKSVVARLDLTGLPEFLTVLAGNERTIRKLDVIRSRLGDDPADWLPAFVGGAHAAAAE